MKLSISQDLSLPVDVVTERLGFLGQSGSGKSYAAMKLAELMLDAGAQVIALDPVGPWWGLRASADGKTPGFSINVFGGIHGDVPLTPTSGELVADVLVDRGISAVIDVSDFTIGEMHKFVTAFAERFFERKKRSPTPVHVFFEEAHTFMPQNLPPDPHAATMLHRVERIVRVGRNYGVGTSQISQMPQAVNKKALNQISCLFAMRTLGARERKAIGEWFDDHGTGEDAPIKDVLPKLATGTAYVASPSWLKVSKKARISEKSTFDSSATPKFGVKLEPPKALAKVDVEALREAMVTAVAEAEKTDPTALRRRVAHLEAELAKRPAAKVETKVVEKNVLPAEECRRLLDAVQALRAHASEVEEAKAAAETMFAALSRIRMPPGPPIIRQGGVLLSPPHRLSGPLIREARASVALDGQTHSIGEDLRKGERKMLEVLASGYPTKRTISQLSTLAGFTMSGGTFQQYLRHLKNDGYVAVRGHEIELTQAGLAVVGAAAPSPQSTEEVLEMWRRVLRAGERKMLDELVKVYPDSMSRGGLGGMTGFTASGGTFQQYLRTLIRNGLVEPLDGDQVRASGTLFLGEQAA